ncbi:MAG TPA: Na+/H+ antiporter NhaA [Vicinamibacterales bacterium]|nr:Na+/H+ antiporter NhaA [Vicinamibacterales bacterium]
MTTPQDPESAPFLPDAPVDRWLAPVTRFLHIEAASGVVLLACTAVALALANSPAAEWFAAIWKTPVSLSIGGFVLSGDVGHLIVNDGLMTIFFFVVGLEVKREMVHGELRDRRKALLPLFAAAGGVLAPAAIYLALQWGEPGQRGWAIPMATDIAFVVGVIALFGKRVPLGFKILLLSLAIVDDIIAVLIIAFVFTETLAWGWLGLAAVAFVIVTGFNRIGVRSVGVYVVAGVFIWLAFLQSGVHPTVAGVLLGLLTPASAWIGKQTFVEVLRAAWERASGESEDQYDPRVDVERTALAAREVLSPLHRLEFGLHPWVAFGIMPLFALANAGVVLSLSSLGDPVAIAVAAGLAIGKPVGIIIACVLAVRLRVSSLPEGVTWGMIAGGGCLAGIGFTMALFLNALAFPVAEFPAYETAGKVGTLAGSLVSAVLGAVVLLSAVRRRAPIG